MAELYESTENEEDGSYDPNEEEGSYDPFSDSNVHKATLIVLLRIYDLLAVQGIAAGSDATSQILELHKRGGLVSPPPYFIPPEDIEEAIAEAQSEAATSLEDNPDEY